MRTIPILGVVVASLAAWWALTSTVGGAWAVAEGKAAMLMLGSGYVSGDILNLRTFQAIATPGCSSILSVCAFAGTLGVAHFDMGKTSTTTFKAVAVSVPILIFINIARIAILMDIGGTYGVNTYSFYHDWLGWAFFMGFYFVALFVYARLTQ